MRIDIRLCACALLLSLVAIVCSGIFGHMAPPPPPSMPADAVSAIYRHYSRQILLFSVLTAVGTTLQMPAYCALSVAMLRMRPRSLFLAGLQVAAAFSATMGAYLGGLLIAAAAVRPDGPPGVVAALNDTGVIFIEMTPLPALLQGIALAVAIRRDRSPDPILPKWLGWLFLAFGLVAQGGFLSVYFDTGPFAPTGTIGLGLPLALLLFWQSGTTLALFRMKPQHWAEADAGTR